MIISLWLAGCSGIPVTGANHQPIAATQIPAPAAGMDHYVAWIPASQAQTASVAEAMTHISLRHASEKLRDEYCAGEPLDRGRMMEKHGPVATRTPPAMGGEPAWYYRISFHPVSNNCNNQTTAELHAAIASKLPPWLSLQPAAR